jgi:hypothetical protein
MEILNQGASSMPEDLPEKPNPEFEVFQRIAKAAFTTPKSEIDAADHEEKKKARKRVAVKPAEPTTPKK